MRKSFIAALVIGLAAFLAPPAGAMIGAGEKAPAWEVKDVVNTTTVDVQTLQGRVVLLEIFRTW